MSIDLHKLDVVPRALHGLPVWVLWKSEPQGGGKKPKKVPHYANGKKRSTTDTPEDRAQLVTLDEARNAFRRGFAGLGIALGKVPDTGLHLSGIDTDRCIVGGVIDSRVEQVLAASHDTYAEVSPSKNGLKLFGYGDIGTDKAVELEIYSAGRFFTVTGDKVQGDALADLTDAAAVARRLLLPAAAERSSSKGAIPAGARNNTLFSYACSLRFRNTPDEDAWAALQARNADCDPPLDASELKQIFASAWRYPPGFATTDLGNRDRLVAHRGDDLRYLVGAGWHVWTGQRYEPDQQRRVIVMMGDVARGIYAEAAAAEDLERRKALSVWARTSESRSRIEAAAALAESHPALVDMLENFDADPLLVGVRNGVVNLATGEFRPAARADRITKQAAVEFDAAAQAPRWQQFQHEIHGGNAEVIAFMQRAWGYTLSGDTSEQVFFIKHGDGENGKGVEQEVLAAIFGDYALAIEPETLMKKNSGGQNAASSDIAEMRGARFIYTSELEDGQELAEKLVKRLTGQDTIRARFLYRERFSFRPVAKFWISTNHRPEIRGTDHAIWRRVRLIPYSQRFTDRRDPHLTRKLLAERAGIFNWLVAGYMAWQQQGLAAPDVVKAAGAQFRTDMDQLGAFLEECTRPVTNKDAVLATKAADVYRRYTEWAKATRSFPILKARQFHEQMERQHGHHRVKHDTAVYPGVLLVAWERADDSM